VSGEPLFVISIADQTNGSYRSIWTAGLTVCNWPEADVSCVRCRADPCTAREVLARAQDAIGLYDGGMSTRGCDASSDASD
jgi:hypothetical protein